jgi:hypothetical protein
VVYSEINQVRITKRVPKASPALKLVQRDKLKTDRGGHGQKSMWVVVREPPLQLSRKEKIQ